MDHRAMSTTPHNAFVTMADHEATPPPLGALDWVLHRVRLRAERRRQWLRALLEWDAAQGTGENNYHSLIQGILEGRDNLEEERAWQETEPNLETLNAELAEVEEQLATDQVSRLALLVRSFGLSHAETAILHTCLAIALEPQLERVCSYLQDHNGRGFVTLPLVSKLFSLPYHINGTDLHALKTWHFVREVPGTKGEPSLLEVDPWVCNWLRGHNRLDSILVGKATFPTLAPPLDNWPLGAAVSQITHIIQQNAFQKLRICIKGAEGSGRQTFAAHVAERFGLPLMVVDTTRIHAEDWPSVYLHAQRQAYLSGFAVGWRGDELTERQWPKEVLPVQLQFAVVEGEEVLHPQEGVVDIKVELPPLTISIRRELWRALVPTSGGWDADRLEHLATRYQATVGQIAKVGQRAARSTSEAIEILRDANRHQLGKLAQLLRADFKWEDLSLHPLLLESLQDFVFEAKERESWWETSTASRLFPQGKGLMALFSGPSGTGKTMTAQVMAASLEHDLFRIDLSNVISKYVGETSKHIDRILSRARNMHAVLLFDEADTLFGKRTEIKDAHDRFANADTNYLLQAIENYPGVAILATNRKANIDPAFVRRLRFVFEFNRPDASQRLQLWKQLLAEIAGPESLVAMVEPLRQVATMLELTGAQIKYAVLSAVFVARREGKPLNISHVLKGVERELAKEGKGLSPETGKRLEIYRR